MLTASHLTRRFGERVAVDDVSFALERGEIFALLGPNGAGKTTTLRMLAGLIAPSSGEVRVGGETLTRRNAPRLRRRIGLLTEAPGLWDRLSVRKNLEVYARLYGIDHPDRAVDEALAIARQITDALEAAHEHGIIHRDLKPANIKVRPDGTVKVLDFGLAKLTQTDSSAPLGTSESPTITTPAATGVGVVLGTAAYMAPEQAKGKPVDKRVDIWGFGAVLYEMLTGQMAFGGDSVVETLGAVLKSDPDFRALPAAVPASMATVLRQCLAKDPKRRLRDIADVRLCLEESATVRNDVAMPAARVGGRKRAWAAAAAGFALASVAWSGMSYFREASRPQAMRFQIAVPPMPAGHAMAISPDGRAIAYVANTGPGSQALFVRAMSAVEAEPLPGTEGALDPFWSPDGRHIGFFSGGMLKRIEASGGRPQTLCDAPDHAGATWSEEDVILFGTANSGLHRVAAAGGEAVQITTPDSSRNETAHRNPFFLPGGRRYIYRTETNDQNSRSISAGSLDSDERMQLLDVDSQAQYVEPGYLIFHRDGVLFADRFDPSALTLAGNPVRIADNVAFNRTSGNGTFTVSNTGVLAYRTDAVTSSELIWFNRSGQQIGTVGEPGPYATFDLLGGSDRIVAARGGDVWAIESQRNVTVRMTFDPAVDGEVVSSPDGTRVAFTSNRRGSNDIFQKQTTGASEETLILGDPGVAENVEAWSSDGRYLAFVRTGITGLSDVYALPLFGAAKPFPIANSRFREDEPRFSFDDRWLAYVSDDAGPWQVYVVSFPEPIRKYQISSTGGAAPHWRRDGGELYYLDLDGKLMAVNVAGTEDLTFGVPRLLFDTRLVVTPFSDQLRVSPDGQRFLLKVPDATTDHGRSELDVAAAIAAPNRLTALASPQAQHELR